MSESTKKLQELDQDKLQAFLSHYFEEDRQTPLKIQRYSSGYSNLTFRVRFGSHDLVLRRPPFGPQIKSGHDMEREYRILTGLHPIYPKVPRALTYVADLNVLDAPFYLMERVEGVILLDQPESGLDTGPEAMRKLSQSFVENLAAIHGLDWAATSLQKLARQSATGYVERQITGWRDRYERAKTDDLPQLERCGQWLTDHLLPDTDQSLIHNDYKYDNLILNRQDLSQIVAVLDWEMATIGDPLMDLGTTLAYWIQASDAPELRAVRPGTTTWPGNFTRAELIHKYAVVSGRDVENAVFYYVYGLFKVAVIVQQIYTRYKQGFSTDERFARLLATIKELGNAAVAAIETNRID